jgi:hypothetical protein
MGILTDDMKRLVDEQQLGFCATVCPDGSPNLSPKGSTRVWDDDHLFFADVCSPQTIANLRGRAAAVASSAAAVGIIFSRPSAAAHVLPVTPVLESWEKAGHRRAGRCRLASEEAHPSPKTTGATSRSIKQCICASDRVANHPEAGWLCPVPSAADCCGSLTARVCHKRGSAPSEMR